MNIRIKQFDCPFTKDDLYSFFSSQEYQFPDPFSNHVSIKDYLEKLLRYAYISIAVDNQKIVGMACAYVNDEVKKTAHFQMLLVDKQYQGYSIGKKLCWSIIDKAQEAGMKQIVLTVDEENERAISLYSFLGYVFYSDEDDKRAHKLHMVYDLVHQTKRVQGRLLEMGKIVTSILEKHSIPYFITFGTLLGAVRHKGFIPWDDDFDLFLFNDTYDEALAFLRSELPCDMFLEYFDSEPKYFHAWAHIKDMNSCAFCSQFPQDGLYSHKGISIDLYKLQEMDINDVDDFRLKENIEYLYRKHAVGLIDKASVEKAVASLNQQAHKSIRQASQQVFGMVLNEKYVTFDEVFPLKYYSFENSQFWGPNNSDSMLKRFYGEYWKLPAENERIPHYSSVLFYNREGRNYA